MKKILAILVLLFLIIFFSIYGLLINNRAQKITLKNYNKEYEQYLDKTLKGTELATLINKIVDINETNKIKKDENNYYIDNRENSIKIEIKMMLTEKTYPMEEIYNNDMAEFIKYFNLENFKCTNIKYHSTTGKVSNLFFEQI